MRYSKSFLSSINLLTISLFLLISCTNSSKKNNQLIFEQTAWFAGQKLAIKNDSCIAFTKYDTIKKEYTSKEAYPINLSDSTIVFTRFADRGYYNDNRDFNITHLEKIVDTVKFDLKYINKQPKLILYLDPFPIILSTKDEILLPETQNFKPITFLISEYSIGDQIDRSLLKTRGIYNYPNYTIEDCEFIENKDITFKIIGYNTIYSIERRRIEDYRKKEVVNVVSSKLNIEPDYRPMRQWVEGADYEYEFYRWSNKGVQINLSRSKYIGNESYKKLVGNDSWILSYDDSYTQAILVETYRNGQPKSSIIN